MITGTVSIVSNISVYMNNCDIYESKNQIKVECDARDENNKLYISNSKLHDIDSDNNINIKIDNNTHKLYVGKGNNFTKENTNLP